MISKDLLFKIKLLTSINRITYLQPEQAKVPFQEQGFSILEFFDQNGVQAYILVNQSKLVISIRGTDQKKDIIKDLQFLLTKWDDTNDDNNDSDLDHENNDDLDNDDSIPRVHYGFKKAFNTILPTVEKYINMKLQKDIYFTGHSYGAAIALLLSTHFNTEKAIGNITNKITTITIGQPKVGNKEFKKLNQIINNNIIRVRNNMDIITKIPFNLNGLLAGGYKHFGKLIYLDYNGQIIEDPNQWILIRDSIKSRLKAWSKKQWWDGVYDHSLEEYNSKILRKMMSTK